MFLNDTNICNVSSLN